MKKLLDKIKNIFRPELIPSDCVLAFGAAHALVFWDGRRYFMVEDK